MEYPSVAYGDTIATGATIAYAYDRLGRLTEAIQGSPTEGFIVRRTYFADGSLKTETNTTASYDSLAYGYDAAGARIRLVHRESGGATDSIRYVYAPGTGDLSTMTVYWDAAGVQYQAPRVFTFAWDALGRRQRVTYPASADGMTVDFAYDRLGIIRRLFVTHEDEPSGADVFDLWMENQFVDPVGRILKQHLQCEGTTHNGNPCGTVNSVTTANQYNRMGWLVRQKAGTYPDSMQYDASGNLLRRVQNGYPADSFITQAFTNRLFELRSGVDGPRRYIYDADGSRRSEIDSVGGGTGDRWYFYDGLGRTSGMRVWSSPDDLGGLQFHGGPNTCRYDPLGRQVIACANAAPHLGFDGDNIVRAGDWSIVQGPGIDDPLVGFLHPSSGQERELFHVTDGQGRHYATADGTGYLDSDVTGSLANIGWNATGGSGASSTFKAERLSGPAAPGLSFFRNRIYDQQTGRWTQEDPIGVSGGVNLYQFNGNNPVAYTDPFGLCKRDDPECPPLARALAALKGGIGRAIDRIAGDAPAAVDAVRRASPGTTRTAVANKVANPPDLGTLDYSISARAGPIGATIGTGGGSISVSPSLQFTITADATYTAPGKSSSALGIGTVLGEGLVAGGQWNGGSGTISVGAGFSIPIGSLMPHLDDPFQKVAVKAVGVIGDFTSVSGP